MGACCLWGAAAVMIPLAVVVAVMLETPTVTEFPAIVNDSVPDEPADANAERIQDANALDGVARTEGMGSGGMFDRIASVYDSTNKWMSLGLDQFWRKTLVQDCLSLEAGDSVLDLATGTADVSLLVASQLRHLAGGSLGSDAAVLGVDPSAEMLRRGVAKVEQQGMDGIVRLVKGDAQDLTTVRLIDVAGTLSPPGDGVADGSIDKISMSFGIRNVPDRAKAFREMRRVLRRRPSSKVCILEFALPSGASFLSQVARRFITHVVPLIGKVATLGGGADEYKYLERSILKFPNPTDFAASMAHAGLPVQRITSFAYGAVHLYQATPLIPTAADSGEGPRLSGAVAA